MFVIHVEQNFTCRAWCFGVVFPLKHHHISILCGACCIGVPVCVCCQCHAPQSSGCVLGPGFPTVITQEDCLAAANSATGVGAAPPCQGLRHLRPVHLTVRPLLHPLK